MSSRIADQSIWEDQKLEAVHEIVAAMKGTVPEGHERLDRQSVSLLRELTDRLLVASDGAKAEYARYLAIRKREFALPKEVLARWLGGKNVAVTGGTGCVGSVLIRELVALHPRRVVSISRGITDAWPRLPQAEYISADVRDRAALEPIISEFQPDVIFHLAAQRDPALAEREVHRTVTTNVLGTRNVVGAAERARVPLLVLASTGKALRLYTPGVYASSKRTAEWLVSAAARRGVTCCSAARFTHVVDNSIVHQRILDGCVNGLIRLHDSEIAFYAQSAREAAQLLLCAGLGAAKNTLWIHAMTDLGWPVSLLDLTLGMIEQSGVEVAIYFSGYEPGYENSFFPGLYDLSTAGNVSPLINSLEADLVCKAFCAQVDAFPSWMAADPGVEKRLLALDKICQITQRPQSVHKELNALSWSLLDVTLRYAPSRALAQMRHVATQHRGRLSTQQQRILAAMADLPLQRGDNDKLSELE